MFQIKHFTQVSRTWWKYPINPIFNTTSSGTRSHTKSGSCMKLEQTSKAHYLTPAARSHSTNTPRQKRLPDICVTQNIIKCDLKYVNVMYQRRRDWCERDSADRERRPARCQPSAPCIAHDHCTHAIGTPNRLTRIGISRRMGCHDWFALCGPVQPFIQTNAC